MDIIGDSWWFYHGDSIMVIRWMVIISWWLYHGDYIMVMNGDEWWWMVMNGDELGGW